VWSTHVRARHTQCCRHTGVCLSAGFGLCEVRKCNAHFFGLEEATETAGAKLFGPKLVCQETNGPDDVIGLHNVDNPNCAHACEGVRRSDASLRYRHRPVKNERGMTCLARCQFSSSNILSCCSASVMS
jgi:hypothetical protein